MKNKFREHKFKLGDLVSYDNWPNKSFKIAEANYSTNSGEQNVYKLFIELKSGRTIKSRWIPENQLKQKT